MATAAQQRIHRSTTGLSHAELIELNISSENVLAEPQEILGSWRRSLLDYRVDADSFSAPHIITQSELRVFREPLENILLQSQDEIDRLYAIVRPHGYVVLLCNNNGVAVHHRGDESNADVFKRWGIWVGGIWSEQTEGTNGIGTCIAEKRPVLVHGDQHFRSRHTQLSCASSPIFDPHGQLVAVLDVSRVHGEEDKGPFPLILDTIAVSARAIEERMFREHFRQAWTIAALPPQNQPALLLAVDEHQWMTGADRIARSVFGLNDTNLAEGIPLSTAFEYDASMFRRSGDRDIPVQLLRADGSGHSWSGLLTPPLTKSRLARSWAEAEVHCRPRINTLGHSPIVEPSAPSRGGLPPGLTQRICEFIESHLDQKIGLDDLAAMAGLSTHHFARAFHQSVGMPPHNYLLTRRLEQVERMLRDTQLPLSEIAVATGFSDQSHLARHFRRRTGVSPSVARWRER
jgi:AraC-like DNA-binding protein